MKVVANWKESLAFDVVSDNGHQIKVDTTIENGSLDSGMSPKKLVLAGLCGCSGMDVVDILNKMKVAFTKVEVSAEAEQTDEHPKVFKSIQMLYRADVAAEDLDKLTRAV
ncbi:MAG: OsmC family protein, partial [Bacteroidota bacterium]